MFGTIIYGTCASGERQKWADVDSKGKGVSAYHNRAMDTD